MSLPEIQGFFHHAGLRACDGPANVVDWWYHACDITVEFDHDGRAKRITVTPHPNPTAKEKVILFLDQLLAGIGA
jgi:hypothetical protein